MTTTKAFADIRATENCLTPSLQIYKPSIISWPLPSKVSLQIYKPGKVERWRRKPDEEQRYRQPFQSFAIFYLFLSFVFYYWCSYQIQNQQQKLKVRPQSDSKTPQKLFQNQDPQGACWSTVFFNTFSRPSVLISGNEEGEHLCWMFRNQHMWNTILTDCWQPAYVGIQMIRKKLQCCCLASKHWTFRPNAVLL